MRAKILAEAKAIHAEDREMCHSIGRFGAGLLENVSGVLTHCNAGGLATAEYGTALSVFFTAQDQGHNLHVFVDETRPLLQGARLTAWELMQRDIKATLICDSMAAQVMREKKVQAVVTGFHFISLHQAARLICRSNQAMRFQSNSVLRLKSPTDSENKRLLMASRSTTLLLT
jgi:methylthioribose-1-phosphate isomerase